MPPGVACTSTHRNDAPVAQCDSWCDLRSSRRHCSWCKCRGCSGCRDSKPPPPSTEQQALVTRRTGGACMSNGRGLPLPVLPRLGMGTGAMSAVACDKLAAAVETFVRGGGTSIDTALTYCGFGGREHYAIRQIARGLKAAGVPRHCMWLTSKIPITSMGYVGTLVAVNATLRAMKVSYLDLLLVHRPNAAPARTKPGQVKGVVTRRLRLGTWRALSEAQAAGQVRFLGVSNYGHPFLRELREACARHGWPLPSYHELEYHPWISAEQRQLVEYSRARGMRIVGYNSLGGFKGAEADARLPALQAVMGAHNISTSTALLRYSIDSDVAVIPFASSPEHIAANLAAGRLTRKRAAVSSSAPSFLSAADLGALEAAPRPESWASFETLNDPFAAESLECESASAFLSRMRRELDALRGQRGANRILDVHDWPTRALCPERQLSAEQLAAAAQLGASIRRSTQPFLILPRHHTTVAARVALREMATSWDALYPPSPKCGASTCECSRFSLDGMSDDGKTGDARCHTCQVRRASCRALADDPLLLAIARGYYEANGHPGYRPWVDKVMGNVVRGVGSNSGGGWHQDESSGPSQAMPEPDAQFKCLMYVESAVGTNGPFTLLLDYDRKRLAPMQISDPRPLGPGGRTRWHRYSDETINNVTRPGAGGADCC